MFTRRTFLNWNWQGHASHKLLAEGELVRAWRKTSGRSTLVDDTATGSAVDRAPAIGVWLALKFTRTHLSIACSSSSRTRYELDPQFVLRTGIPPATRHPPPPLILNSFYRAGHPPRFAR